MTKPEPKTVTVPMNADTGDMYLLQQWISGTCGPKEYDLGIAVNGPIIRVNIDERSFDFDLSELIQAATRQTIEDEKDNESSD